MKITIKQSEKQHIAARLHDALHDASLNVIVESTPEETYLTFADELESQVRSVINSYVYVAPPPPSDFKMMMAEIESADVTVDFSSVSTLAELKTKLATKFQKIEARQLKMVQFMKTRAGLK